jgi:hypothetical protein
MGFRIGFFGFGCAPVGVVEGRNIGFEIVGRVTMAGGIGPLLPRDRGSRSAARVRHWTVDKSRGQPAREALGPGSRGPGNPCCGCWTGADAFVWVTGRRGRWA